MKTSVKYNLKHGLFMGLVAMLPFAGCEKESYPKFHHNVKLKYGISTSSEWKHLEYDTLRKYNADEYVDTIFMIPESPDLMANMLQTALDDRIVRLRGRHNINPDKIFGYGDIVLMSEITDKHPEIIRFFADTLKYNVICKSSTQIIR